MIDTFFNKIYKYFNPLLKNIAYIHIIFIFVMIYINENTYVELILLIIYWTTYTKAQRKLRHNRN